MAAVVLGIAARMDLIKRRPLFYALFAVSITASVQLVGVFLVFASLIIPALAAQGTRWPMLSAYGVGLAGYVMGLLVSAVADLPSGAAIVCALVVTAAAVVFARWCFACAPRWGCWSVLWAKDKGAARRR